MLARPVASTIVIKTLFISRLSFEKGTLLNIAVTNACSILAVVTRLTPDMKCQVRSPPALSGIKIFAQSITDKIEGQYRQGYGQTREDQSVRRRLQRREIARLFDHYTPRRRRRRHAESKERQRRF